MQKNNIKINDRSNLFQAFVKSTRHTNIVLKSKEITSQ